MTVGEYFKMSSSIIFLSCLIPKRIIINILWQFYHSKIDFSNELNCKKSLNLIQCLEDDILNYSSTVMFRGTPCMFYIIILKLFLTSLYLIENEGLFFYRPQHLYTDIYFNLNIIQLKCVLSFV